MKHDKQCLDTEDEEMEEVTQALMQEDVAGKRQHYIEAQSQHPDNRMAVGLSSSHSGISSQEHANNLVPFHAVSQVIASSNQGSSNSGLSLSRPFDFTLLWTLMANIAEICLVGCIGYLRLLARLLKQLCQRLWLR